VTDDATAAAAQQIKDQDTGLNQDRPSEADVAGELAHRQAQAGQSIGSTDTDPAALLKMIHGLQDRLDAAEAQRRETNAPPLVAIAESARDNLQAHADSNPGTDHTEALGLAGDLVEAAKDAVTSGTGTRVEKIAARLESALGRVNPGPGDHHWYRQALDFVGAHMVKGLEDLEDQNDQDTGAKPSGPVVPGSVVSSR
jgi:hypothetical protein